MTQSVAIFGRQPEISLAELESLFGAEKLTPLQGAAVIDLPPADIPFQRLGGSVKLAKLLTVVDSADWPVLEKYLVEELPGHVGRLPEGKLTLGLSAYRFNLTASQLNKTGLKLKKIITATGRPGRIVPNNSLELSSAQVLHNKLFTSHNWELILFAHGSRTYLAQTVSVQDIDAYAARDQARPRRDARVGMLPPKLAQTIINLARPTAGATVLDPFCGTGVILQEAALMGFNVYGTDLEPRMVDYTQANLDWLNITSIERRVEQADATNARWQEPFDLIASETYLGRPFSARPQPDQLNEVVGDVDTILKKFLNNTARQTKPGFQLCIAVPAWKTNSGFKHLPTLDKLTELGYTRTSFVHVSNHDLIYHREGQIVGRELVVLNRL